MKTALFLLLMAFAIPPAASAADAAEYHGNIRSGIFHKSSCRYFNCRYCTAKYRTREDAMENGFRPCKVCKP